MDRDRQMEMKNRHLWPSVVMAVYLIIGVLGLMACISLSIRGNDNDVQIDQERELEVDKDINLEEGDEDETE